MWLLLSQLMTPTMVACVANERHPVYPLPNGTSGGGRPLILDARYVTPDPSQGDKAGRSPATRTSGSPDRSHRTRVPS